MWKKDFRVQGQTLLKRSQVKGFRTSLQKAFPSLASSPDGETMLNLLLPPKDEVTLVKVAGSHTNIYLVNKQPLFFDLDGKSNFYPTVYALWKVPNLLPTWTVHTPVFQYILNGADLMLPGVRLPEGKIENLGPFELNEKRAIVLSSNPVVPIAVGTTAVTSATIQKQGMRGKGLYMVHYYQDFLWKFGSKAEPPFLKKPTDDDSDDSDEDEEAAVVGGEGESKSEADTATTGESEKKEKQAEGIDGKLPEEGEMSQAGKEMEKGEEKKGDGSIEAPKEPQAGEQAEQKEETEEEAMNRLLEQTFLEAVKGKLKNSELPVLLSTFYSSHMLPCKPPGATIDIKKSSYKKISKFVQAMAEKGIVKIDSPAEGVMRIVGVCRDNFFYRKHKVDKSAKDEEEEEKEEQSMLTLPMEIVELYKIPNNLRALEGDEASSSSSSKDNTQNFYSQKEALELLWKYIAANDLNSKTIKGAVTLDILLSHVLYKGDNKTEAPKRELAERFVASLQRFYKVQRGAVTEFKKGLPPPIKIQVKARQGGRKHVTLITGLEAFLLPPDEAAAEFQRIFAASTTTSALPGKPNIVNPPKEVLIQGNVLKRVGDYIAEKYNVPKKYIQLLEHAPKNKKK